MSLKVMDLKSKLQKNPKKAPKFGMTIKNGAGKDVVCGDPRATRSLVALINMESVIGGAACHWGGPAAFAEGMSAIHALMLNDGKENWFEDFNFVNDAGHAENGIYALRSNLGFADATFEAISGFRSVHSKFTGHGEAHLNPEHVLISNGPLGSSLPQAQGLALADKLSGKARVTICTVSDGASMEGEAKEAFAAIPGLAAKGKMNPFLMVISDNDKKLSGGITDQSFSMAPTFNAMEALGWKVIREPQGNDLQKAYLAIEQGLNEARKDAQKPVCVLLKTVKGYGVKSTEESASGAHGYPLKAHDSKLLSFIEEVWKGDEVPAEISDWAKRLMQAPVKAESKGASTPKDKIQTGVSNALIRAAADGLPVFSISSDLPGSTGMSGFQKECPERSQDMGIAESNMVSVAAGMSKLGFIPVVDTFAAFGATKGNLPLVMASLSEAPIIAIYSHTGFQDAADGASHQSTTYFGALAGIPHVKLYSLSCKKEAEELVYLAAKDIETKRKNGQIADSYIFFLGRETHPVHYGEQLKYDLSGAQVLKSGNKACLVATGPLLDKALTAAEILKNDGVEVSVVNLSCVNHPPLKLMSEELKKNGGVLVTLEDHQDIGGMGSLLVHGLVKEGETISRYKSIAIPGVFGQSAYVADHLYKTYGMDGESVAQTIKGMI